MRRHSLRASCWHASIAFWGAIFVAALGALGFCAPVAAQEPGQVPVVTVDQIPCLPQGEHGVVHARVENEVPGTEVRLYFRRLNSVVEDFYWVEMEAEGEGRYWVVVPSPTDDDNERHDLRRGRGRDRSGDEDDYPWAAWWLEKETSTDRDPNGDLNDDEIRERASVGKLQERDWMRTMDLSDLQDWLRRQTYEPAEYFAAVVAPDGTMLARSPILATSVTDDCEVELDLRQQGMADNLVIGETAVWQEEAGEVFHWLCDGIVSRVDFAGILRVDRKCRVCIVAWWKKKSFLIPATVGSIGIGGVIITDEDEPPVSPSVP
jgi:hypothetical protein